VRRAVQLLVQHLQVQLGGVELGLQSARHDS
jgi:hypothetical protein